MMKKIIAFGSLLLGGGVAWSMYQHMTKLAPFQLQLQQLMVPMPRLGASFAGIKFVQISDIHMAPHMPVAFVEYVVARSNSCDPDWVVLTGDFVSKDVQHMFTLTPLLKRLQAKEGVVAILGNHDYAKGKEVVISELESAGIRVLCNEGLTLTRQDAHLYLAGLDDIKYGTPDLDKTLAEMPANTPCILLAHEPDCAPQVAKDGRVTLQLSGHTHGGQGKIPLIGSPRFLRPTFGKLYVDGVYQVRDMWLYVSRGVGMSNVPARFHCPPEITEIVLMPA